MYRCTRETVQHSNSIVHYWKSNLSFLYSQPLWLLLLLAVFLSGTVQCKVSHAGLISLADIAPASTIRHDRLDSSYTDLGALFPATGRVTWPGFIASGNFIGNFGGFGWVLTAAHVVDDGTPASQFDFFVNSTNYDGAEIFLAPGYTNFEDSVAKGDDIALLRLATEVIGLAAANLYSENDEVGEVGTHVGFGRTGTGSTGDTGGPGTKRGANNTIDGLGSDFFVDVGDQLLDDFDNPSDTGDNVFGSSTPLDLEGLIAPGDSGGGWYVDFGFGHEIVGIHSFTASTLADGNTNSDYGDISGSTRVSSYFSWIESTVSPVPEPSSIALSLIAILLVIFRHRRLRK